VYSRTLSSPISGEKHLFVGLTTPSWKLPERSILSFVVCVFYDDVFFFCTFSLVCESLLTIHKPQSALSLCSRFKIDRPLVGDDDQQKCKISKRRSLTENCVIMQRVSEPISLSLSSRGRKAVATTCFFSTFRVFCRYKIFVGVVFARSSLSFFSLSLSLSLSYGRRRDNARR
jgi:hypothetical protein